MIAPVDTQDRQDPAGMDYLGPEFLTWLWWRGESNPCFHHADGTEVYIHFDEHLEFRGERSAARRTVLRAGMPGASMEARAALRSGKSLVAARILMARDEEEMRFTLRAEQLAVSGLRLPSPEGETREDRLLACLSMQETFVEDLDLCFSTFLKVRCVPAWEDELEAIRTWGESPSADERLQRATT
jgi:hypothetical protein